MGAQQECCPSIDVAQQVGQMVRQTLIYGEGDCITDVAHQGFKSLYSNKEIYSGCQHIADVAHQSFNSSCRVIWVGHTHG